jgi:PPOX class probable F420-dependent enzyme
MATKNEEFRARAARRLREERIIWLITTRSDGMPQPSPVWFLWDGESFLIFSRPGKPKLRNIQNNPNVALHFDSDGLGGDIIIYSGIADIEKEAPPENQLASYLEKYQDGLENIRMDPDSFTQQYSIPIRVIPTDLRGH